MTKVRRRNTLKIGYFSNQTSKLMARVTNNILLKGMSGPVGGKLFRTFKDKSIYGKIPDMSGIIPSKKQTRKRSLFAAAVKYAKSVMKDPAESARYKTTDGSVYHAAIKEYMAWFNPEGLEKLVLRPALKKALQSFTLTCLQ